MNIMSQTNGWSSYVCVYIRFSDILTVFKTLIFEEPSKQCHVERIAPRGYP